MAVEEVSALPPVAGRCWTALSAEPIDAAAVSTWVIQPGCGAVVTFCGTARDHADGRPGVTLLDYEAYEEHVVPTLDRVVATAIERFPAIGRIAVLHRVGRLQVTDVAVVVAVSTPHRQEAFDAARWAIDEVKAQAPIWKREHHDGGVDWGLAGTVAS